MGTFLLPVQLRWSDLDPNFHVRHSVYYDWGALCRISFFEQEGLTPALMQRMQFGPILFREECVFRREIKYGDKVSMNLKLLKSRRDFSRWTIIHEIKKEDDVFCAAITVEGAWINVAERKLFVPPAEVAQLFEKMPLDEKFEWS
jgi:acyl-CoA thioester hydrolase